LTGDPEAQVSAPPAKGGGTARVAIAVIVVVAIVVLAAIGAAAFAFTSAANDHKATVAVLEGVRVHNNDISVQLKQTPSFSQASLTGPNADFAKFRRDVEAYRAKIKTSNETVTDDITSLKSEDARIQRQSASFLASVNRGQYEEDKRRVSAMIDAFEGAKALFGIVQEQLDYLARLADAFDKLQLVNARVQRNDFNGALAAYSDLDPAMQSAVAAAGGRNIPPELQNFTSQMKLVVDDLKVLLQAAVAQNTAAAQTAFDKLNADAKALQAFNESDFQKYEQTLLTPYRTRYEEGVKAAGFTLN
jgi:hypothetical protein